MRRVLASGHGASSEQRRARRRGECFMRVSHGTSFEHRRIESIYASCMCNLSLDRGGDGGAFVFRAKKIEWLFRTRRLLLREREWQSKFLIKSTHRKLMLAPDLYNMVILFLAVKIDNKQQREVCLC